jgi:CubicO group peptidase (beta-lactamase class C family)
VRCDLDVPALRHPTGAVRQTILACPLSAFATACGGQPPTPPPHPSGSLARSEISRILDSARAANDLPALAAAIVTRDTIWALAAVGLRRAGGTVAVKEDDQFHLGSDPKAMTAGLLGLLVDEKRLEWNSTLDQLFPDVASVMRPEYRTLTLRELLSHQSGLVPNPTIRFMESTPRAQRVSFVKWVLAQPPTSARGTYSYANFNYIVAGAIAERVLVHDWAIWVRAVLRGAARGPSPWSAATAEALITPSVKISGTATPSGGLRRLAIGPGPRVAH